MFEERALLSAVQPPEMWLHYVDDIFMIWPHGLKELKKFHQHLNSQNQSVPFTYEEESKGRILFLDTLVERKSFKVTTSVYRKQTNTDR